MWQPDNPKWPLHYFVDPMGRIPKPNRDTLLRKELEARHIDSRIYSPDGTLFWIQWTKEEDKCLKEAVLEVRQAQINREQEASSKDIPDANIDYAGVAMLFNERTKVKKGKYSDVRNILVRRSATECRNRYLYHLSPHINKAKWTEEESFQILELAHKHNYHPPWEQVALALNSRRTPWQCFQHFQQSLNAQMKGMKWTPRTDELLFKYLVLQGPRFLLSSHSAGEICRKIMHDRSITEVTNRASRTLLNPNFINEQWSEEDERKLVMLMKVYKNDPNPVSKVWLHYPYRARSSVREKWYRSLSPEFSQRPWTKDEDRALLSAVAKYPTGLVDWTIIAKEIPNRRVRNLRNRWVELVDEETLLRYRQERLLANQLEGVPIDREHFALYAKQRDNMSLQSRKA